MSDEEITTGPDQTPATTDAEVRAVGARTGMFGVRGTGDTSGYGGLVAPIVYPAWSAARPGSAALGVPGYEGTPALVRG